MSRNNWTEEQKRRYEEAERREQDQRESLKRTFLSSLTDLLMASLRPAVRRLATSIFDWFARLFR